jgi:uncharacterized RDD family membrane protein YckC
VSDPTPPSDRPSPPGLTSGDPLAGSGTADPPAFPSGYTSPPPPGAGGVPPGSAYGFAPGALRLAGWWSRVGAALIDGVIIGIVAVLLLTPLGIGAATVDSDAGIAAIVGATIVTTLVFLVVAAIYAPVMMSRTNGQTLGRMAVGIRVVRASGARMTFGFAALREIVIKGLLFGIAGNVTFGLASLLDVLWPLWDEENRALHDMVVNTRVVEA